MSDGCFNLTLSGSLDHLLIIARGIASEPAKVSPDNAKRLAKAEADLDAAGICLAEEREIVKRLEAELRNKAEAAAVREEKITGMEAECAHLRDEAERYRQALEQAENEVSDLRARLAQVPGPAALEPENSLSSSDDMSSAPEVLAPPHSPAPVEPAGSVDFSDIRLAGRRREHFDFIVANCPTLDDLCSRFSLKRQQAHNRISELRVAIREVARIELIDSRLVVSRVEPASAIAVSPASAVAVPTLSGLQPAAKEPVKDDVENEKAHPQPPALAHGNVCRVSIPLLTMTGPKGVARVNSSLFAKVLAHMADGQMYGVDKLRKVGGYATDDAVRTAFLTHRPVLARVGLSIYVDKINARLQVLG